MTNLISLEEELIFKRVCFKPEVFSKSSIGLTRTATSIEVEDMGGFLGERTDW